LRQQGTDEKPGAEAPELDGGNHQKSNSNNSKNNISGYSNGSVNSSQPPQQTTQGAPNSARSNQSEG